MPGYQTVTMGYGLGVLRIRVIGGEAQNLILR